MNEKKALHNCLTAIAHNDMKALRKYFQFVSDINCLVDNNISLLQMSCLACYTKPMLFLLKKGADPNKPDNKGITPVMYVSLSTQPRVTLYKRYKKIKTLVAYGANVLGYKKVFFDFANNKDFESAIDYSVEALFDTEELYCGMTVLMIASFYNLTDIVELCIKTNTDLNSITQNNLTALDAAIENKSKESIELLKKAGVSCRPNIKEDLKIKKAKNKQFPLRVLSYK